MVNKIELVEYYWVKCSNCLSKKIKNIEESWIGAQAEKPIRDLGREEEVTEEEKAILDRLAERRGEKAMKEYAVEKEKNPVERLLDRVDKIATEMREKGLEEDAGIVEKIKARFGRYAETIRKRKEECQEKLNRRIPSIKELKQLGSYGVRDRIPVTYQIGESGGKMFFPDGHAGSWFGKKADIEGHEDAMERIKQQDGEVINFGFSKQGETEFYRAMGVLGEKEEAIDIPTIYQKAVDAEAKKEGGSSFRVNPLDYEARFPTNIEGVNLLIKKEKKRSYDGQKEEEIDLVFDDEFQERILDEK